MIILTTTTKANLQDTLRVDRFTVTGTHLTYWVDDQQTTIPMSIIDTIEARPVPESAPPARTTIVVAAHPAPDTVARLRAQYGNNLPVDELINRAWQQARYLD